LLNGLKKKKCISRINLAEWLKNGFKNSQITVEQKKNEIQGEKLPKINRNKLLNG
jgi:hypothetical protein